MKSGFPTESTIRQYLLGRLDDQEQLEKDLSRQMLFDHELSEVVDSIEDEIIEDYLDGSLSAADKKAVEDYFLRPVERRKKLEFAGLLRQRLGRRPDVHPIPAPVIVPEPAPIFPGGGRDRGLVSQWRSHFRTYCELAALVVFTVSLIYVVKVHRDLQSQLEATKKQLEQEHDRAINLAGQLQEIQQPVARLTFLGPILRGSPDTHVLEINPSTPRIKVEIGLQGPSEDAYDVRLETQAGAQIWSQTRLKSSSGGLRFEMPAQNITTGTYCLVVSSQPERYCFHVKVTK